MPRCSLKSEENITFMDIHLSYINSWKYGGKTEFLLQNIEDVT